MLKMASVNKNFAKNVKQDMSHLLEEGQQGTVNGLVGHAANTQTGEEIPEGKQLQWKILEQLEKVNKRLDRAEDRMAAPGESQDSLELSTSKFSTPKSNC